MAKFYQRLLMLIVLVALISGAVIYFTVDIHTLNHLDSFRPWSVAAAIVMLFVGLVLDGTRLMHLVRISGERITLGQGVQVVFGNYFLALLTPGATGGAVAQVMFLRQAGVPMGKATVFVVVRTLLSILFLFCCMPLIFYYDPGLLPWISARTLVIVSVAMLVLLVVTIWLLRTRWPSTILLKLSKRLKFQRRRQLFSIYRDVQKAVALLLTAPVSMLRVFTESALSLLALYSVVPVLFMGLGVAVDWPLVMGRMIFLNILLYFAPTPGGSGVAEGGFVLLFNDLLPSGTVGIVAVAWRIICEYLPFFIGLCYTVKVFGQNYIKNR